MDNCPEVAGSHDTEGKGNSPAAEHEVGVEGDFPAEDHEGGGNTPDAEEEPGDEGSFPEAGVELEDEGSIPDVETGVAVLGPEDKGKSPCAGAEGNEVETEGKFLGAELEQEEEELDGGAFLLT